MAARTTKHYCYCRCDICGGKMYPKTMTRTFLINRKEISLGGIGGFRCINCGEEYFDANEVSKIDDFLHTVAGTKIENSSQYWRGFYG